MKRTLKMVIIIFSLLFLSTFLMSSVGQSGEKTPIEPSEPSDVYIEEIAQYDAPVGDEAPLVHLHGILYWERLSGTPLSFFINTTDVIESAFWDYDTGENFTISEDCFSSFSTNCVQDQTDRYIIIPGRRSFAYSILSYYDPDIIEDTGMIVIFNSQIVDF